jgi:hypothetical protein
MEIPFSFLSLIGVVKVLGGFDDNVMGSQFYDYDFD